MTNNVTPREGAKLARSKTPREVDAIVFEILSEMAEGSWTPDTSAGRAVVYAIKYEVEQVTVRLWASHAGRLLRLTQDPSELRAKRAQNVGRLDGLYELAVDQGGVRDGVTALAEQGKLLGLHAAEKHEVSGGLTTESANEMIAIVMAALETHPAARDDVVVALREARKVLSP